MSVYFAYYMWKQRSIPIRMNAAASNAHIECRRNHTTYHCVLTKGNKTVCMRQQTRSSERTKDFTSVAMPSAATKNNNTYFRFDASCTYYFCMFFSFNTCAVLLFARCRLHKHLSSIYYTSSLVGIDMVRVCSTDNAPPTMR